MSVSDRIFLRLFLYRVLQWQTDSKYLTKRYFSFGDDDRMLVLSLDRVKIGFSHQSSMGKILLDFYLIWVIIFSDTPPPPSPPLPLKSRIPKLKTNLNQAGRVWVFHLRKDEIPVNSNSSVNYLFDQSNS